MILCRRIDSPVGPLMLAAGDDGLRHIEFRENRHPANRSDWHGGDSPVLQAAEAQLREYFAGSGADGLYLPVDLGIARCRLSVAVRHDFDYAGQVKQGARLRVATKYLHMAREHFATKGVHVDLVKLYGSMELAPLTGLADAIVDLVSTGGTLKANGLVEVEHIMDISARLIVNQAALKTRTALLKPLIDQLREAAQTPEETAA